MMKINPLLAQTLHSNEGSHSAEKSVDKDADHALASKNDVVSISMEGMKKHIMSRVISRITENAKEDEE